MAACGIITQHTSMLRVWEVVKTHAKKENHTVPLYIYGESGSGKDPLAQAVARLKGHAPAEAFNCNVPEQMFLLELFGSRPGAFTGAVDKPGLIEKAAAGVLFLDQFCSITSVNQLQALRAIEMDARDYRRLGGTEKKRVECKFVIADTLSPREALEANNSDGLKRLIPEIYSRLRFFALEVPPLRNRHGDIPLLVEWFLNRFNRDFGKNVTIDSEVTARFSAGRWPGNIRALRDVLYGIVFSSSGHVNWVQVRACVAPEELARELGEDSGSRPAGRKTDESDEKGLRKELETVLDLRYSSLVEEMAAALQSRHSNNPGRHLFYAALIHLAKKSSHEATASELAAALKIADGHVNNLCHQLEKLLKGPVGAICRCVRENNTRRYRFHMPAEVLSTQPASPPRESES